MPNAVKITKAVFPVAGWGTRTLPATKITAKEMLPIVDKPLIQYAVEEALAAGIDEIIFVTAEGKHTIAQHFAPAPKLEARLQRQGKQDACELVHDIVPAHVSVKAVIQEEALGLGHAVLCAHELVGDAPVAVLLPDDLIHNEGAGCLAQMLAQYERVQASLVAVEQVPQQDIAKYGIVEVQQTAVGLPAMRSIVEKPAPEAAPSNLAVVGRYLLSARIWRHLERTGADGGGEIQLTDAIARLLLEETVYLCEFAGQRYDCGSKLGLLKANVALGLEHPETGAAFSRYLSALRP